MFSLILTHKQATVACSISNQDNWQLLHQLFSPSTQQRYALKSIFSCIAPYVHNDCIAVEDIKWALENRWVLLSILEDTIDTEKDTATMDCLNAINWHKRTTYSIISLITKNALPNSITVKQLQHLLTVLGITITAPATTPTNRREKIVIQQKDNFQLRHVQYTHFGYRLV